MSDIFSTPVEMPSRQRGPIEGHTLQLSITDNNYPVLVVTCVNQSSKDRLCYAEGLNKEKCMVIYCAAEVGWDAVETAGIEKLIDVGPIIYRSTGSGEDYEDWLVIP